MWGLGGFGGKGRGKSSAFEEEDRSRDWYCSKCRERNFAKRAECFKCGVTRSKETEAPPPPISQLPASGSTLNGMVKSYNKKGFGFIMCLGRPECQDIYYTREHLSPRLQTRDIPGEHVTFELIRLPNGPFAGKLEAHNVRPINTEPDHILNAKLGVAARAGGCMGKGSFAPNGVAPGGGIGHASRDEEDRSRDWMCGVCGERNFVKRFECFRCKTPRPAASAGSFGEGAATSAGSSSAAVGSQPPPRRTFSPHAGSRAVREVMKAGRDDASSHSPKRDRRKKRKKRGRSGSDSESSASSRSRSKRKKKSKKHRARTSSESSDEDEGGASIVQASTNPEIDKAKAEALDRLVKLRDVEPAEVRMKEWRALLRQWHPDKNPDRTEVATAVFQFLQKGKAMLEK